MGKITKEQKEKFYELYLQGYRGKTIAKRIGINRNYSEKIVRSFDTGDFSWLSSGFRHYEKRFTESERVEIVKTILRNHNTFSFYVAKFDLPEDVLRRWIRNYNTYGVCARKRGRPGKEGSCDTGTEENQRAGKAAQIRAERDYLLQDVLPHLRRGGDGSSKKKILRAISECRKLGIPLKDCLARINLSASTYHFWKKHENDINEEELKLADAIRGIQEANHWAYGAKRMAKSLVSSGFCGQINHKKVERIMNSCDLHAKIRRRRFPKNYYLTLKENAEQLPKNDLARDFKSDKPFAKLVTDVTYLPTKEGWLYLAAVKDLFNNEIVSYRTDRFLNLKLAVAPVKSLVRRGVDLRGAIIHSDMGWTYTNRVYVDFIKKIGAHQSMSRKGNCWDNACIENFFGLFKSETLRQEKELLSVEEMNRLVDNYIVWYNNERIQKKLGYLSPVDYRKSVT